MAPTAPQAHDHEHTETLKVNMNEETIRKMSIQNPDIGSIAKEALKATEVEHQMGLWKSLTLYPKAVGWSVLLSTAIVTALSLLVQPVR